MQCHDMYRLYNMRIRCVGVFKECFIFLTAEVTVVPVLVL